MLTVGQAHSPPVEIGVVVPTCVGTFSANGECLAGWDCLGVGVWRVEDGKQVGAMKARLVQCLAVSIDGKWIAAGTFDGDTLVWDANTYKQVFAHKDVGINGVDFSPDSTRLVSASSSGTAIVWDIATREQVRTLHHEGWVAAAKYSPQGDRIATATLDGSVRIWDSNDGRLLVEIPVKVSPFYNTGLLWFHDHLFVLSKSDINEFEASTGSALSRWPVPGTNLSSSIALPEHGEFIAYSTGSTVAFWDTSTHAQLDLIQLTENSPSIALPPDNRFLAIGESQKITFKSLSHIIVSIVFHWIVPCPNMLPCSSFYTGFNPILSSTKHALGT